MRKNMQNYAKICESHNPPPPLHHYRPPRHWYGANIIAILYAPPLVHQMAEENTAHKTCTRYK